MSSPATLYPDDDTSPDVDPRETYEHVARVVDYQTGGPQPPLTRATTVRQIAARRLPVRAVTNALTQAFDHGRLFWVRVDGRRYLGIDNAATLRAKVASHAARADPPNAQLIGVANQRIDALGGGDDE